MPHRERAANSIFGPLGRFFVAIFFRLAFHILLHNQRAQIHLDQTRNHSGDITVIQTQTGALARPCSCVAPQISGKSRAGLVDIYFTLIRVEFDSGQAALSYSFLADARMQQGQSSMAYSYAQIIDDIDKYMRSVGGSNFDWYVGIASEPRHTLFTRHRVAEQGGSWIYRQAISERIAREIEKAYLDTGHDGGPGGGNASTDFVYAYFKTSATNP